MTNPFPPELRTVAIIPRWSVVWTLNRDVVSSHSFFVALYSYQIAEIIGWRGDRARLMFVALAHDLDETISGDVVSPAKRAMWDSEKASAYLDRKMQERMPAVVKVLSSFETKTWESLDVKRIVAAADRLDALLFLTVEQRMGNRHVFSRCQDAMSRLKEAWMKLPIDGTTAWETDDYLEHLWNTVVVPAVVEHENGGGSGV